MEALAAHTKLRARLGVHRDKTEVSSPKKIVCFFFDSGKIDLRVIIITSGDPVFTCSTATALSVCYSSLVGLVYFMLQ